MNKWSLGNCTIRGPGKPSLRSTTPLSFGGLHCFWQFGVAGTPWLSEQRQGLLHLATDFVLHAGDGATSILAVKRLGVSQPGQLLGQQPSRFLGRSGFCRSLSGCLRRMLWQRGLSVWGKSMFGVMLLAEVWVARQWLLFF